MSQVKDVFNDRPIIRYAMMIVGLLISSIAINGFIRPAHLLSGGATGVSVAINYLTGINVGLLTFLINIPIFILGFIYLDKEFCILSLINMVIFSLLLGLTTNIGHYIKVDDIILRSLFGGALSGIGLGIVFKTRASMGGTDIICAILKIKRNISIKDSSLAINCLIVIVGSFLFGLRLGLYTLINFFMSANFMNITKDMLNSQKNIFILSKYTEEIANTIMRDLVRGVTYIHAEGAYTNRQMKMIYLIVSTEEIPIIMDIIDKYDKKAFVSVTDVIEVRGRGFKPKQY